MNLGFPLFFGLISITILGLGGTPLPQSRCPAILFCRGKVGANSLGHAGNDGHHPTKMDHAGILKSQVVNAMSVHDMCMVHLLGITQDIFPIWM